MSVHISASFSFQVDRAFSSVLMIQLSLMGNHLQRKCVPSWDAFGGGSGAKTILLMARIAARIGHAVPLSDSNAR